MSPVNKFTEERTSKLNLVSLSTKILSAVVCMPSIGKHQKQVHGFLFFK